MEAVNFKTLINPVLIHNQCKLINIMMMLLHIDKILFIMINSEIRVLVKDYQLVVLSKFFNNSFKALKFNSKVILYIVKMILRE